MKVKEIMIILTPIAVVIGENTVDVVPRIVTPRPVENRAITIPMSRNGIISYEVTSKKAEEEVNEVICG